MKLAENAHDLSKISFYSICIDVQKVLTMLSQKSLQTAFWMSCLTLPLVVAESAQAATIDKRVFVQPIQVCQNNWTCAPVNFFEAVTDKIWNQAGIDVFFMPLRSLISTTFYDIDNQTEFDNLTRGSNTQKNSNSNILNMWFVNSIFPSPSNITFGQAWIGGNGIAIDRRTIQQNRMDTVAHEIGHNLGLHHSSGSLNLMTAGSSRTIPSSVANITPTGTKTSQLTSSQISTARNSRFARLKTVAVGFSKSCPPWWQVWKPCTTTIHYGENTTGADDNPILAESLSLLETAETEIIEPSLTLFDPTEEHHEHEHFQSISAQALTPESIPESVPEPSGLIGLLTIGLGGLLQRMKHYFRQ